MKMPRVSKQGVFLRSQNHRQKLLRFAPRVSKQGVFGALTHTEKTLLRLGASVM